MRRAHHVCSCTPQSARAPITHTYRPPAVPPPPPGCSCHGAWPALCHPRGRPHRGRRRGGRDCGVIARAPALLGLRLARASHLAGAVSWGRGCRSTLPHPCCPTTTIAMEHLASSHQLLAPPCSTAAFGRAATERARQLAWPLGPRRPEGPSPACAAAYGSTLTSAGWSRCSLPPCSTSACSPVAPLSPALALNEPLLLTLLLRHLNCQRPLFVTI